MPHKERLSLSFGTWSFCAFVTEDVLLGWSDTACFSFSSSSFCHSSSRSSSFFFSLQKSKAKWVFGRCALNEFDKASVTEVLFIIVWACALACWWLTGSLQATSDPQHLLVLKWTSYTAPGLAQQHHVRHFFPGRWTSSERCPEGSGVTFQSTADKGV